MITKFDDFTTALLESGFSLGGGNSEGIFALSSQFGPCIRWHTEDRDTDPWEWRMRVLDERDDISYAKVFFNKSGFITKEWYPCFLAARRGSGTFEQAYRDGKISSFTKRIYNIVRDNGSLPLHVIKQQGSFSKEDKARFERALVELQMRLYLTMCGRQQKINRYGGEYGWSSTVFCTTESFWGDEVFEKAISLSEQRATEMVAERILLLNPQADRKKIIKFIKG